MLEERMEELERKLAELEARILARAAQPVTEDQKPVKAEDQKVAPAGEKTKKKISKTVERWRQLIADKAFASGKQFIHVVPEHKAKNPKRNKGNAAKGAASRFALYVDGMSVEQYIEKSHKTYSTAKAQALADVR